MLDDTVILEIFDLFSRKVCKEKEEILDRINMINMIELKI